MAVGSALEAEEHFKAEGSPGLAALALAVMQLASAVAVMQQEIDEKEGKA